MDMSCFDQSMVSGINNMTQATATGVNMSANIRQNQNQQAQDSTFMSDFHQHLVGESPDTLTEEEKKGLELSKEDR